MNQHPEPACPAERSTGTGTSNKREWQAPLLTSYQPVSETQAFTGIQPGDGINNAS
jgi:hypothetical protein